MAIEIILRKTIFLPMVAYHPPSQPDLYFFDNITKILNKYTQSYHKVLLAGDFNAQVNETYINKVMSNHDLHSIVKEPICF